MTAYFNPSALTDSATRRGSSVSSLPGRPESVLQNLQLRVHMFPPIISVAVRAAQHSVRFGQSPLVHIVLR